MLAAVAFDRSTEESPADRQEARDLTAIYERWFDEVVRWIPAMGGHPGDVEDVAQEVFLSAGRRLRQFDGKNPGGWLYAITLRTVQNHRRLAWFRKLVFVSHDERPLDRPDSATRGPAATLERKELAAIADRVLAGMSATRRRAFVLFEIEGYSGEEIAALESIPVATVWTRLHHARKAFVDGTK